MDLGMQRHSHEAAALNPRGCSPMCMAPQPRFHIAAAPASCQLWRRSVKKLQKTQILLVTAPLFTLFFSHVKHEAGKTKTLVAKGS
ncbi:hypothetical protein TorRG33x02_236820 [Trema orientale]|uniref:Uncharacterized protein n=1 Tax=Trema orientale TaxID=63057 RepID=A0A2P5E030_TREOI|nr:hypothetical protein TorRG33x02_236820 [Trema orientale]